MDPSRYKPIPLHPASQPVGQFATCNARSQSEVLRRKTAQSESSVYPRAVSIGRFVVSRWRGGRGPMGIQSRNASLLEVTMCKSAEMHVRVEIERAHSSVFASSQAGKKDPHCGESTLPRCMPKSIDTYVGVGQSRVLTDERG